MRHELYKFLALVEYKSFTLAAKRLHVSQPALSMAIKSLENELSTQLLIRYTRHFELTESGKIVYDFALRMRYELDAMRQLLTESNENIAKRLRIGMIDSVAETFFNRSTITAWDGLTVTVDNSRRLIRDIELDRLDVACIVAQPEPLPGHIVHQSIGAETFVLVCHPSQKVRAKQMLESGEIERWLSYNLESSTYQILKNALDKQGVRANPIFFSTSPDVLKRMVLHKQGVALLPEQSVVDLLQAKKLTQINKRLYKRPLWIISRAEKYKGALIKQFIDHIKHELANQI